MVSRPRSSPRSDPLCPYRSIFRCSSAGFLAIARVGVNSDSPIQFSRTVTGTDTILRNGRLGGRTRVEMVMATIRQRIHGRSLAPGAKLPSVRGLAGTLNVTTWTVVEAYERLVAEGAIHSRPGSGFYVASQTAPLSLSAIGRAHV